MKVETVLEAQMQKTSIETCNLKCTWSMFLKDYRKTAGSLAYDILWVMAETTQSTSLNFSP